MTSKKIALIHDWLTGMRGGERCLEAFIQLYPDADVFTLIHVPGSTSELIDSRVKGTSCLQKLPGVKKYYRLLLPFFPLAARSIKLQDYDLVISLSHAAAKNVPKPKGSKHICYCFTPMRYVWDQADNYLGVFKFLFYPLIYLLRYWDRRGADNVDFFVAISSFVAARIRCFYGRKARVIYPPVDNFWYQKKKQSKSGNYFLYAGALVPYKNVAEIIMAFNDTKDSLIIAGSGPEEDNLKKIATDNIQFVGRVSDGALLELYQNARALVFAAKEDFGLIPIECLASGTPVIAPFIGALKESLNNAECCVFFRYRDNAKLLAEEIRQGVKAFKEQEENFQPEACIRQAEKFSIEKFKAGIKEVLQNA